MTEAEKVDNSRRHFLLVATTVTGIAGAAMTAVPFLASWKPSARAQALGAPVEVDISKVEPGAMIKVEWRGQAVFLVHRTPEMLATLPTLNDRLRDPGSEQSDQPPYAKNETRAVNPEFLVAVGVCTHLGCAPMNRFQPKDPELGADWPGGFYCPCHGSKFDLAGRVFKDVPAPLNLRIPPYRFINDGRVLIGADTGAV
ncbi:MAG TPA: ubiquinol-cytochrome c reductase iron-sulfur subunit [Steroidobacteraceae bacterium]|nr:ubiquinol-cytochrome c reductase iron-sulfur subunit [Steroidobacteraceae bacterium]